MFSGPIGSHLSGPWSQRLWEQSVCRACSPALCPRVAGTGADSFLTWCYFSASEHIKAFVFPSSPVSGSDPKPQGKHFSPNPFSIQACNSYQPQEAGHRERMWALGQWLAGGRGVEKRSPDWHERARETENLPACTRPDSCVFRLCLKMLSPKGHGAPTKGCLSQCPIGGFFAGIQNIRQKKIEFSLLLSVGARSLLRLTLEIKSSRLQGNSSALSSGH